MTVLQRAVLVRLHAISSGEHKASFVCLVGRSCLHGYAAYTRAQAYSPHRVDCVGLHMQDAALLFLQLCSKQPE